MSGLAPDGPNILRVEGLRKSYGKKEVVRGVSFSMKAGEVVGFLGPNGAGKTTVFYSIVGFIRPNAGTIHLDAHDITHQPMYKRARAGIAYLPQEASVFRKLTVEENIYAVLETRRELNRKQRHEALELLLEELDITSRRKQMAYTLSGGERRRTEIARALAIEPKFLLLDEPFAGIDPKAVHEIKHIIGLLTAKGIGVLITDHNVRDTLSITDRAYIVQEGTIAVQGSKDEIMENRVAREVYLGESFSL
jgi:lipopolysaccharide export system ATP-binding protein